MMKGAAPSNENDKKSVELNSYRDNHESVKNLYESTMEKSPVKMDRGSVKRSIFEEV